MMKSNILGKEIGQLLTKVREKSSLSQTEVAQRIGLSKKFGQGYISRLEKGKTKNPPLQTILLYLKACGESWSEFFKKLDNIDFKMRHEKMIAQLPIPPTQRKIQRDAMRYETGIEFPSKEKEEIDFERLKKRIKDKVIALLIKYEPSLRVPEGDVAISKPTMDSKGLLRRSAPRNDIVGKDNQGSREKAVMTAYQKFAMEYFEFLATLNKPGMKMVVEKYQRAGLARHLIFKIRKIVFSVIGAELKRIEAKKPLPTEKQERMALGFTKYRIRIEQIEAEVHKLLCELGVKTPWFTLYKDFARQCYQALKKYYIKDQGKLTKNLTELVQRWQKQGLEEKVLLKVKDKVISVFGDMRRKGRV
jgi:transcriptional regulator with XRE-family HTH domain